MLLLQNLVFWAALSGAVFPFPASAGEWENYQDLKAALFVSKAKGGIAPSLPRWIQVEEFEPRPHYRLDALKAAMEYERSLQKKPDEKPTSLPPVNP